MDNAHSASRERMSRLVKKAADGNETALQQVLTAYQGRLRAFVRRRFPIVLAPLYEPEDFVQQTLAQASANIAQFTPDGDDAFFRWIVIIARHEMAQALRRQRALKRGAGRRAVEFGANWEQSVQVLLQDLAWHQRTPSQSAVLIEVAAILSKVIEQLDEPMRLAVQYRYIEQMTVAETARQLGRTERAINGLLYRALKALRESLASRSHYC